jgi:hypothetical protein
MNKYFDAPLKSAWIMPNGDKVDTRAVLPANSLKLWLDGFPFLFLKKEAIEILKDVKTQDLLAKIEKEERKDQLVIIRDSKPKDKLVQEAVESRLAKLSITQKL